MRFVLLASFEWNSVVPLTRYLLQLAAVIGLVMSDANECAYAQEDVQNAACAVLIPPIELFDQHADEIFRFGDSTFVVAGTDFYTYRNDHAEALTLKARGIKYVWTALSTGALLATFDTLYLIDAKGSIASHPAYLNDVYILPFDESPHLSVMPNFDYPKTPILHHGNATTLLATNEAVLAVKNGSLDKPVRLFNAKIDSKLDLLAASDKDNWGVLILKSSDGIYIVEHDGSHFGPFAISDVKDGLTIADNAFLLTNEGIYAVWKGGGHARISEPTGTNRLSARTLGRYVFFNVPGGVLRWNGDVSDKAQWIAPHDSYVRQGKDSIWMIGPKQQLSRYRSDGGVEHIEGNVSGNIGHIFDGPQSEWILDDKNIYRLSADKPGKLEAYAAFQSIAVDYAGHSIIAEADKGLYLLAQGRNPEWVATGSNPATWQSGGGETAWFKGGQSIRVWQARGTNPFTDFPYPSGVAKGQYFSVEIANGDESTLIFGKSRYRPDFDSKRLIELPVNQPVIASETSNSAQSINSLQAKVVEAASTPDAWVFSPVAHALIFSETSRHIGKWNPHLQITSHVSDNLEREQPFPVSWKFGELTCRTDGQHLRQTIIVENRQTGKTVWDVGTKKIALADGDFQVIVPGLPEAGEYRVVVTAADVFGQIATSMHDFTVGAGTTDIIKNWLKQSGLGVVLLSAVVFFGLVVGSRWSVHCFDILIDPVFRRVGLYFGPAIRHIRPLRLWIFERYFQQAKQDIETARENDHAYLPVALDAPGGAPIKSNAITPLVRANTVTWISGDPGTGKTEIIKELSRQYFAHKTLRQAWRAYGYIPIFVTVRDSEKGGASGVDWLPDVAQRSLSQRQLRFEDAAFFRSLLSCGDFAVILDGMNESSRTDDLQAYLSKDRNVRILATSQGTSPVATHAIKIRRLSPADGVALLEAFLGHVHTVSEATLQTVLGNSISGYDIQLIANLIEQGIDVPSHRFALYEATLKAASDHGGQSFREEPVCQLAWKMWLTGARTFIKETELTSDIINALKATKVIILRDSRYEFRHDLMRGFLAARRLRLHASFDQTLKRLSDEAVWELSSSDQDSLFPFLVELCRDASELNRLLAFALEQPAQRIRLIEAIQAVVPGRKLIASVTLVVE